MPDDMNKRGPQDRTRINVNEPWELRYWCQALNASEVDLKAAVKRVGVMVSDVRQELQRRL